MPQYSGRFAVMFIGGILILWGFTSLFDGTFTTGRLSISVLLMVAGVVLVHLASQEPSEK